MAAEGKRKARRLAAMRPAPILNRNRSDNFHNASINLHSSAHSRRNAHRIHSEGCESASCERSAYDHVSPHPESAKKSELQRKTNSSAERSSDFGSFVVVFEELLVFRFVVEIFVSLLEVIERGCEHLVEPFHGTDISDLFLHADTHLSQVVFDDATQLFHASSIIVGNHGNRREEQHDVPGERWRNVEH